MSLPKLKLPTYTITLPASKQKVKIRPYTTEEEKLLLLALENAKSAKTEDDLTDVTDAVKNLVQSCLEPNKETVLVDDLPNIDFEYLFLNVRMRSVGQIVEVLLKHPDGKNAKGENCDHNVPFQIDLNTVEVHFKENHTNKIMLDDTYGVVMKYPSIATMSKLKAATAIDMYHELIAFCIDYVYDKETVYNEFTESDALTFVKSMTNEQIEKIVRQFFETQPSLRKVITYKCPKCGEEETVTFEGFFDFFS